MKTPHLLFEWPTRHRIHLLLPFALVTAALLHIAIFFLFSVKHPSAQPDGPNEARLYYLSPTNPGLQKIESTLYSSDPALYAPGRGLPDFGGTPAATLDPIYTKNLVDWDQPPLPPRPKTDDRPFHGAVRTHRVKAHLPPSRTAPAVDWRLSPGIADRWPARLEAPRFQVPAAPPPEPAEFLIALTTEGTVLHILTLESSGNPNLDRAAAGFLRALPFKSSEKPGTVWGFVKFFFGPPAGPESTP